MWPFQPFQPWPVYVAWPAPQPSSNLDRRAGPNRFRRMKVLGDQWAQHDFINFPLEGNDPGDTLAICYPVMPHHLDDISMAKLALLLAALKKLQQERVNSFGVPFHEVPTRQYTIDCMTDVLGSKKDEDNDDDHDDEDSDEEDDDDDESDDEEDDEKD